jgi:aspartate aminotransferase
MAVMLEAQQLRAQGIDVIDLGPGQPDFPTPEPIKKAGIDAIIRNFTRYTASAGLDELREGIAESFNRRWDTHFGAENVVVTAGAKPAVFNVCMAAFQDGDEVVIPSPYWVTFPEVVKLTGASPVQVPTFDENGFVPEMDSLESVLTDRTRGLILNTPNNPTGAVIPESVLGQLIEWTRSRGLFLLSDETYGEFTYAGREHVSLAAYLGESAAAFAVVGSFSKVHSMTGWRIGYCLGPTDLMAKVNEFQSHQSGNPCSISQKAAIAALHRSESELEAMRQEFARRRSLVLHRLERLPGFRCVPPAGAFYVFPNVEEAMSAVGCEDSVEFSRFLLREARVATVPGSAFGADGYIRLSYAAPSELLEAAFDRLAAVLHRP